jgi:peptidoglycan/LPS O-acetylase OafA/YrhL
LNRLKGVALVWIFLNHAAEQIWRGASLGNPYPDWPPLLERIRQWAPLGGYGLWGLPVNLFRYVGWLGDQAVGVFLIASGFGLTWGLLRNRSPGPIVWKEFYLRRVWRIYPLWWAAHALLLAKWLIKGLPPGDASKLILSLAGLRMTPSTFEFYSPSWWFIGLLIQLYLVFPILFLGMNRWGPRKFLIATLVVAALARGLGMMVFKDYMDPWIRGSIFITRLPEFVLGMVMADALGKRPERTEARLRSRPSLLASGALYLLGTFLSLTWAGMTVAPFVVGLGAFGLLYPLLSRGGSGSRPGVLGWIGFHSYPLYLVHQSVLARLVTDTHVLTGNGVIRILLSAVLTVAVAWVLEGGVGGIGRFLSERSRRRGPRRMLAELTAVGVGGAGLLVGAELLTRWRDPMEVQGWGERPSLAYDEELGWKLKPSRQTRLRWESYDYTVIANSLGFPGPEYPPSRSPGSLRILVTGDAFTSAEGVSTDRSWPRLLETELCHALSPRKVEVLNFAITAYGPQQYAAVTRRYVPLFRPDWVIIEFFVNDFSDVLTPVENMRDGIGLNYPESSPWRSVLRLVHLRKWIEVHCSSPWLSRLRGVPDPYGYLFGGFGYLERGPDRMWSEAPTLIARHLAEIRSVCEAAGSRLLVVMAPAAAQVCGPDRLSYYPRGVDLRDENRFDVDRPQRVLKGIADELHVPFVDLRAPLRGSSENPCQPRNMHWTEAGHHVVADTVARLLLADGDRGLPSKH